MLHGGNVKMSTEQSRKEKLIEYMDDAREAGWTPAGIREGLFNDWKISISIEDIRDYISGDLDADDIEEDERNGWTFKRAAHANG
jgi:hypothetical protein